MGALEYAPSQGPRRTAATDIEIDALVRLASEVLSRRRDLSVSLAGAERAEAMRDILSVGTSAGGARAKAVIAFNPASGAVRSGQLDAAPGFDHWLLKFDGVSADDERELDYPQGYGAVELAYAHMAGAAGIEISECRLLEEGGRRHFMTRRFDRPTGGGKLHMQSLGAIAHYDFNEAGANSYEQALMRIRGLGLGMDTVEEQFRRMAFNVIARNQDDHVKNIAFLMDRDGRWSLSPAFDLTYAYRPDGTWTRIHQMTLNGRREGFTLEDFRACARVASMKRGRAEAILEEVRAAVMGWRDFAADAGVDDERVAQIEGTHLLELPGT
jgi:serine/threonine-protein kinase HipA